ncbi:uncharacterized protein FOMMEDRAFT_147007 [Fomitiporia mediterranea MF3/22]|uniref:uncharacterized protein n=1 Tax=Fomitiporia mediterranea (strain MF3/22) TaxID=694068 RepID=UPI0004408787|nr:uncharacterized protein FOMMEDRAFT_147007 [Fomitiporia mediterranea MF3/22]EJD01792.1 hypothetical protein FOMMEDRAFT_147007 [Fomitiporia mediterranea MF3/22]
MASSSNTSGAARRLSSTTENHPSVHTRKRASRQTLTAQSLADRLKHQQVRERQRALQNVRAAQSQDWDMLEETSSQAMTDPWASENSIPMFSGITLPRQLMRAPFRMPRPEALAAIDPGLVETNFEYIKDCMELRGEQMYTVLKNTTILSLHKPHGTHYFPTSARVRVNHAHADLPTHLLAVRSSLPSGKDLADDPSSSSPSTLNAPRPSAYYTPIHALMLAVYAPLLPALPPSDPSQQLKDGSDSDYDSDANVVDVTLPVAVLRIPSPATFGMLIAVLYSQRYDNLVKVLLGIPLSPPPSTDPKTMRKCSQSSLLTQSIFSQLFSPLSDLPPPAFSNNNNVQCSPVSPTSSSSARHTRLTARLTHMSRLIALAYLNAPSTTAMLSDSILSGTADVETGVEGVGVGDASHAASALHHRRRLVQALAANARVLGVCDLAFWGAIDVAWAVLLGALGFVAGSGSLSLGTPAQEDMDVTDA